MPDTKKQKQIPSNQRLICGPKLPSPPPLLPLSLIFHQYLQKVPSQTASELASMDSQKLVPPHQFHCISFFSMLSQVCPYIIYELQQREDIFIKREKSSLRSIKLVYYQYHEAHKLKYLRVLNTKRSFSSSSRCGMPLLVNSFVQ